MKAFTFKIKDKEVGGSRVFVIAEVGSNHNQDINIAFEAIDTAAEIGADAVKFQSLQIKELYYSEDERVIKLHKKIDLEEKWYQELKDRCDEKGVIFLSSPTYLRSVDLLEKARVELYKIASAQLGTFPQLVEKVARSGKPALLSTGLTTYSGLERAIRIFNLANNDNYAILHCNSIYPTGYDKVKLKLINVYQSMFGRPVGFSDHTLDIFIPIAAVSIGATIIEKHFTLDRSIDTPDAFLSLEPAEFKRMIEGIRAVEQALEGGSRVTLETEEEKFRDEIIYRLVLKTRKNEGDIFYPEDFDYKRHYEGIDCRDLDFVLKHMRARKDLSEGIILTWPMLEGINE